MQRAVEKGLKVPCLFMISEVSIRCQKKPGGSYTAYTRVYPPNTPLLLSQERWYHCSHILFFSGLSGLNLLAFVRNRYLLALICRVMLS